jgi:outer membrane scaffolding protein for murein synthesis (MipA/OmpV family)
MMGNKTENQYYYNWTKIYIPYLDGTLFQGYRANPINYKGRNLYFRGSKIIKGIFNMLNDKLNIFRGATEVILAGGSAGSQGAHAWANYLQSKLS